MSASNSNRRCCFVKQMHGQGCLRQLPSPNTIVMSSSTTEENTLALYSGARVLTSDLQTLAGSQGVGMEVNKVCKNGKLVPRRLAISSNNRCIMVTSQKTKSFKSLFRAFKSQSVTDVTSRNIDISCIERIELGHESNRFLSLRSQDKQKDLTSKCISILYRITAYQATVDASQSLTQGNTSKAILGPYRWETLDLLMSNKEDYNMLLQTLYDLMRIYHEESKTYDTLSLFLHYHWLEMGKDLTSSKINCNEWVTICDKANIPQPKSSLVTRFKSVCKLNGTEEEGLLLKDVGTMLLNIREDSWQTNHIENVPLTILWEELLNSDPAPAVKGKGDQSGLELQLNNEDSISELSLLIFIRSQQKEFTSSIEDVRLLIGVLNSMKTLEDHRTIDKNDDENIILSYRLRKSTFFSFLHSDANDIMDPKTSILGEKDMKQPLTSYWINTSHDTYLAKLPNSLRYKDLDFEGHRNVDRQAYINALNRGVRCLELDVYDGLYDGPVVARSKPSSPSDNQSIDFSQVLKSIRAFLRDNPTSYPIILYLQSHCSLKNQDKLSFHLKEILECEDMLYIPASDSANGKSSRLPSPYELRGKVLIKNKRPKDIRFGAIVLNDDFDEENDISIANGIFTVEKSDENDDNEEDEEDEDLLGAVVRFEPSGPIRSADPKTPRIPPNLLLKEAIREASEARKIAAQAEEKEKELDVVANEAEALAQEMIQASGRSHAEIEAEAFNEKGTNKLIEDQNESASPSKSVSFNIRSPKQIEEGFEVQDFFGNSVDDARSEFSVADTEALSASNLAKEALERLSEAEHALMEAEIGLEDSYKREKKTAEEAEKAANDVRVKRQHAEIARQRVVTVQDLSNTSKNSYSNAETVVLTAMTEAKISAQRASEAEARAERARATATKERAKAEAETKVEETLEQEAANLHDLYVALTKETNATRQKIKKCAATLDKINEQIKLIEQSSQYKKEVHEFALSKNQSEEEKQSSTPRHGGSFVAKHGAKIHEREMCIQQLKDATIANQSAEVRKKRVQAAFEEKANLWKMQADVASQSRKQADRSSQHAEDLAEVAEEEREAANLRQVAQERAKKRVVTSDDYQSSVRAQLVEASRASEEAASVALESRILADKLAREAAFAKDHSKALQHVENMKQSREEAYAAYQIAMEKKNEAESKVAAAKRLLNTSSEVFSNAKRDAAIEVNHAVAALQLKRDAIQALRKARLARGLVNSAKLQTNMLMTAANDKDEAVKRAEEYQRRIQMSSPISVDLALQTTLHSSKFKDWKKSLSFPSYQMHSICEPNISSTLEREDQDTIQQNIWDFTSNHFIRTFPDWGHLKEERQSNFNPVVAHGLGCQMVSMNYFSSDEYLLLNEGRFRAYGSCGYVPKPKGPIMNVERIEKWRFNIICGSCLPQGETSMAKKTVTQGGLKGISPYIRVSLYEGTKDDKNNRTTHQTTSVSKNGFNPGWKFKENEFDFIVKRSSVAMILFTVWDDRTGDFIAGSAVPVNCIRQGYRSVALFDSLHSRRGAYAFASLLVKVQKMS